MGIEDLKWYMIGVVLFILVVTSGVYIMGGFYESNPSLDTGGEFNTFSKTMNLSSEVTTSVEGMQNSINSVNADDPGILGLGWLNALVGAAFSGLKAVGSSLSFVGVAFGEMASFFGVPSFVVTLGVLVIVIVVVFSIISVIVRA